MDETIAKCAGMENTFPVKVPEYFNFAYDVVDLLGEKFRNRNAMIWANQKGEERHFTFHDFAKLSNQAANLLLKSGLTKGDRVMLLLPRLPEWWVFSLAMLKLGVVQCPSPVLLTPHDLKQRINFAKFKLVITDLGNAPKIDEIYNECPSLIGKILVDGNLPGWISYPKAIAYPTTLSRHRVMNPFPEKIRSTDPMLMLFTSGTSKMPKLVLHDYSYAPAHRITAELWHGLTANDIHMTLSDTGWGKNVWGNYFGQWLIGACIFIYDFRGKFHAEDLLPILEKYEITSFCAPPTVYRMLVLHDLTKFDLRYLRNCTSAGEALHKETYRLWYEGTGLKIREAYGQTETVCMIGTFKDMEVRPGSIGKPAPGWDVELHDENGKVVADGETGRIAVNLKNGRPAGLMVGYVDTQEENERSFQDGFYYTGDKAWKDKDGYFWYVGRNDDIIKSSGYRISPQEVEDIIMMHPAVQEVGVVGAPDALRGARIKAYIILKAGYEASEKLLKDIQDETKRLSAPYKYPREIEFVKSLPKTISGKIKRDILRAHAQSGGSVNW